MHLDKTKTYHFIGIKGSGMSALALILHGERYKVQGSDVGKYFFTQQELENHEIPIFTFDADNIHSDYVVIGGNAFGEDHPEIQQAQALNCEFYRYHDFLGQLIEGYISIGITGSHGKTSTTGLLAHVLSHLAPTSYLIGDGTGSGDEEATYFVLEACEYRRHFLAYSPDYAIITNVDFDHPDYFRSIDDVFDAMTTFANQAKKAIIACGEDPLLRQIEASVPIHYYGLTEECDIQATQIERTIEGSSFDVIYYGKNMGHFSIPVYGEHNILNALAVIGVLLEEGFDSVQIQKYLANFPGVKRRFSSRQVNQLTIIDDYAHHPSEIEATIDAAKQRYPDREIVAIFQPHTFSRTTALLSEFAEALKQSDVIYLVDIFTSAREQSGRVRIEDLASLIGDEVELISQDHLSPLMDYEDAVILFMGAGDIDELSKHFEQSYAQLRPNLL